MSTATASKSYKHRGRPNPVKNPGAPHRKAAKALAIRKNDYVTMTARNGFKAPFGSFHRPGSMKGPQ